MNEPLIAIFGTSESAGHWEEALGQRQLSAWVIDAAGFVAKPSFTRTPMRLAVIDTALDQAETLLGIVRAAGVPVILASSAASPSKSEGLDPLAYFAPWVAEGYVGSAEELVNAALLVLETKNDPEEHALHLTYRGSIPAQSVTFPIGTAIPLRVGAAAFLGRGRGVTVQLGSPHVGRTHAMIAAVPGNEKRALVVDLQSSNGTFVRGRRITVEYILPGDELAIAGYRFVLETHAAYAT